MHGNVVCCGSARFDVGSFGIGLGFILTFPYRCALHRGVIDVLIENSGIKIPHQLQRDKKIVGTTITYVEFARFQVNIEAFC